MNITLDKLPVLKTAIVQEINVDDDLKIRLFDIGLIKGTSIKKIYKSPLNDPCAYKIRNSTISLRNTDTNKIIVYYEVDDKNGIN